MLAAIFCCLFVTLNDPVLFIRKFALFTAISIMIATCYRVAIFPRVDRLTPPECDLENLATTRQRELMRPFSQRQMDRRAVLPPDLSLAASDFLRTLPIIRTNAATAMRSA